MWGVLSFRIVQSLSRVRLCNPMGCSIPGFPVLHYILEFAQTHVHWISNAIQLSHPLSPLSPPTLDLSQHQDFFQWVGSSHQVAKVLKLHLHHQSFYEYLGLLFVRIDWFDILAIQGTLKRLLQLHNSKASFLQHSAFLWSNSHICTWLLEKQYLWLYKPLLTKWYKANVLFSLNKQSN